MTFANVDRVCAGVRFEIRDSVRVSFQWAEDDHGGRGGGGRSLVELGVFVVVRHGSGMGWRWGVAKRKTLEEMCAPCRENLHCFGAAIEALR